MDKIRITNDISLDFHQRARANRIAQDHVDNPETLAEMVVFYHDLAQELAEACEEALKIHDRYCDRVGAQETWARWVHDKLRNALRKAKGDD